MGDSPGDTFRGHHMYEPSFSQDDMNNSEPWVFGNDRSYGENNLFGHGADHEDLGLAIPDLPQESTLHVESSIITADDITDLDVPGIQAINEALGQSSHYLNAQSVRGPTPHNQQFLHMYSSHQMTEPLKNTVAPMLLHHEWPEIDGGESSLHSPTSTAVSHFEQHRPQNVRRAKQRVRRENCPTVFMQTKDLSQKLCTACFKHPSRAKKPDGRSERWLKMSAPQGDQSPGPLNALSSPSGCRTISVYTSGVRTYEEAVNLLHPFEEGLILENEKVPATAQEVDDVVQRLVDAICTTYTGNDSWLLRKQANFAEKTFAPSDVDEDRYIIAKIRLLVRDTIVLHRGGIFSWPIGGQTAGYRANRALEFTHRISRMETYLAVCKDLSLCSKSCMLVRSMLTTISIGEQTYRRERYQWQKGR